MHVQEVLDQEVTALAGERYARKDASVGGRRHGTTPGRWVWRGSANSRAADAQCGGE